MTTSSPCSVSARPRQQKLRLASAVSLCVLLAAAAPAFAEADTAARDAALCASLSSGAREALALGYSVEAAELLDEALSFMPSDPDANYLRALLGTSIADSPASVAARLETALAGGSFRLFTEDDARLLLASILVRMRRPAEALRLVDGLPTGSQSLYVVSVAKRLLGDESGAKAAVLESMRRYPADPRSVLAWLRARDRPFALTGSAAAHDSKGSVPDTAVVAAAFGALETLKVLDPGILPALAPYAGSVAEARLLVREFRATGGRSADATLLALGYGLLSESRAVEEMLFGGYLPSVSSIKALYGLLSSDESRAFFVRSFSAYTGMMVSDADMDGFNDATASFRNGTVSSWVLDQNQDGIPEFEVSFSSGAPAALHAVSGSMAVSVKYERWPFAASVGFSDEHGSRVYAVGPSVLPLPLVTMSPLFTSRRDSPYAVERSAMALPPEGYIVPIANSVRRDSGGISETAELSGGMRTRAWWSDAFGWHGYATYVGGFPGSDVLDLDGDGRFEARRIWKRGVDGLPVAAYIEADNDGDGMYEYRESLSQPVLKSWDYDGNGNVDLSIEEMNDGSMVYRFRGTGDRDYRIEAMYRNGRVESITEKGVSLPLVADSGGSVVWIGRKPFDFGASVPSPGFGSKLGLRYSVVAIGGLLYAQVLE